MYTAAEQLIIGDPRNPKRIEKEHLARYDFASQFVKNKRVLDIACGTGYGSSILRKNGALSVDGVDVSSRAIAHAREHYNAEGIVFLEANAAMFNTAQPYDTIVSFETIEHVKEYDVLLKNFHRLLKKGGRLILSTPNRLNTSPHAHTLHDQPSNHHHTQEFSVPEIIYEVQRAGFSVTHDDLYGQSDVQRFRHPFLKKVHHALFSRNKAYGPHVQPLEKIKHVRYCVLTATKA